MPSTSLPVKSTPRQGATGRRQPLRTRRRDRPLRQAFCDIGSADTDTGVPNVRRVPAECGPEHAVSWVRAFGAWTAADSDGNAARLKSSIGGVSAGTDAPVSDDWRIGAMAGYSRSSFDVDH